MSIKPSTTGDNGDNMSAPYHITIRVGGKLELEVRSSRDNAKQSLIAFFSDSHQPTRIIDLSKLTKAKSIKPKPRRYAKAVTLTKAEPKKKLFKTRPPFRAWDEDALIKAATTAPTSQALRDAFPDRSGIAIYNKLRDLVRMNKIGSADQRRFPQLLKMK